MAVRERLVIKLPVMYQPSVHASRQQRLESDKEISPRLPNVGIPGGLDLVTPRRTPPQYLAKPDYPRGPDLVSSLYATKLTPSYSVL